MRTIFVGDIHGCLDEFRDLIQILRHKEGSDRLILLGDLIDRGPDPRGVVRLAKAIGAEIIRGNHEDSMLRWVNYENTSRLSGTKNPMRPPSVERRSQWESFEKEDIEFILSWPISIIQDSWIAVHAGLEPAVSMENQDKAKMMRIRYVDESGKMVPLREGSLEDPPNDGFWVTKWKSPMHVVYGHAIHSFVSPRHDVCGEFHCFGMDTGCVFGGHLSALVIQDNDFDSAEIIQTKSRRQYLKPSYPPHG